MIKRIASVALALAMSGQVAATERMYGVVSAGYSDAKFSQLEAQQLQYQFALGHQFLPKWYVEVGYQQLFDDLDTEQGMKADALYLAVLGKAGGPLGELYYKLGALNTDVLGSQATLSDGSCHLGSLNEATGSHCDFDEGVFAGLVGIGFDFRLGLNTMIRLEADHIRGEHDFRVNVLNLGLRYNFN